MSVPISQFIPSLPPGNHKFVFYICNSISVLQISSFVPLFLDSTYKQCHMVFVFLCLTLLSMTISRSIHVAANGIILFFLWLSNIPLYICITSSLSIPLSMDIQLLPCLDYCKQHCSEHRAMCILSNNGFLWICAQEWDCWIIWQLYFQFLKEHSYCFPQWLYQFTFPLTVQEGSLFSTPSPELIICRLLNDSHSYRCEVIPHCGFDLHFSNNQ